MPYSLDESQVPSRPVQAASMGSIFAEQLATYTRKINKTPRSDLVPSSSRTDGPSAAPALRRWPEGFLDQLASASVTQNQWPVGSDQDVMQFDLDPEFMSDDYISAQPPSLSSQTEEEEMNTLAEYVDAVFKTRELLCVRITATVWVLESWKDGMPDVGCFYHLNVLRLPEQLSISCDCAEFRSKSRCVHQEFCSRGWNDLNALSPLDPSGSPFAVEISRFLHGRLHWLSVLAQEANQSRVAPGMHKRCIVSCSGPQKWNCNAPLCTSDSLGPAGCVHRKRAEDYVLTYHGSNAFKLPDGVSADDLQALQNDSELLLQHQAVSHLPVPPPRFALLPTEAIPTPARVDPNWSSPLPIGSSSRCYACGKRPLSLIIELRSTRIYHSTGTTDTQIQVARCLCRRRGEQRTVGPDLSDLGLFNFNNEIVVSHAVLNSYSSQMLRSSTPLTAFHASIGDTYAEFGCMAPFISKPTFSRIFFHFISLQELPHSFSCPLCGSTPDVVIADGVVLAHSLRGDSDLVPPTAPGTTLRHAPRPGRVRPFLHSRKARSSLRQIAHQLITTSATIADVVSQSSCVFDLLEAEASAPPATASLLLAIRSLLSQEPCYAMIQDARIYLAPLLQQLAAEEGQLQLCRPQCLFSLSIISQPAICASSHLFAERANELAVTCPAIGNLACHYAHRNISQSGSPVHAVPLPVKHLWRSIYHSVTLYLHELQVSTFPAVCESLPQPEAKTGVFYGSRQIRTRPQYPGLKEARNGALEGPASHASSSEELTCRKFYSDYVQPRRTGGIMALWCRHAIAVGFHCIPSSEGRDDVFSALLTHWPKAPSVVVYDFACQLASYAIAREPEFFADTLFVVDELHQHGHSRCTPSSWLSTYMSNNPELRHLNSSAAECGNAGLSRIKKTVAYSTAPHAIAITRHFLSLWNRRKINELAPKCR